MEPLLTIRETADRLNVSVATVRRHIRAGRLVATNVAASGLRRQLRVTVESLKRFVDAGTTTPASQRRRSREFGFFEYV